MVLQPSSGNVALELSKKSETLSGRAGIVSVNLLEPCLLIVLDSSWLLVGARNNPGIPAVERLLDFTP